jgi:hypothetical protein
VFRPSNLSPPGFYGPFYADGTATRVKGKYMNTTDWAPILKDFRQKSPVCCSEHPDLGNFTEEEEFKGEELVDKNVSNLIDLLERSKLINND